MRSFISKVLIFSVSLMSVISHEDMFSKRLGDIATLEFPPNQAVSITNPLLWKVKVSCHVQTPDDSDIMIAKIIKGSATLNGQEIKDGTQAEVKNGDSLLITASRLGSFQITNQGQNTVVTSCGLALKTSQEIKYMKNFLGDEEENYSLNFLEN